MNFKDFEYVVERKPPAAVCFGSTIARNTCPIGKQLSAFQRRLAPEIFSGGPGQYATEKCNTAFGQLFDKVTNFNFSYRKSTFLVFSGPRLTVSQPCITAFDGFVVQFSSFSHSLLSFSIITTFSFPFPLPLILYKLFLSLYSTFRFLSSAFFSFCFSCLF